MAYKTIADSNSIIRVADGAVIPADPANRDYAEYRAWVRAGNTADPYVAPAPPRRLVAKSLIVERLNAAGLLAAAKAALDGDLYARERWYAPDKPAVYADDPEVLTLLAAVGADPDGILAGA